MSQLDMFVRQLVMSGENRLPLRNAPMRVADNSIMVPFQSAMLVRCEYCGNVIKPDLARVNCVSCGGPYPEAMLGLPKTRYYE